MMFCSFDYFLNDERYQNTAASNDFYSKKRLVKDPPSYRLMKTIANVFIIRPQFSPCVETCFMFQSFKYACESCIKEGILEP